LIPTKNPDPPAGSQGSSKSLLRPEAGNRSYRLHKQAAVQANSIALDISSRLLNPAAMSNETNANVELRTIEFWFSVGRWKLDVRRSLFYVLGVMAAHLASAPKLQ
jgi:hypothetical protein